ncbi:three-helix bundle dimerization domain-containing protein [Pseudonocardia sichuanensis]
MTSPTGATPGRPAPSSRWTQPAPSRTDENLKHVHRKIDPNLKAGPLVDNGPRPGPRSARVYLPGAPSLMARVAQPATPGSAHPEASTGSAVAADPAMPAGGADDDVLARAWEERMAKQWEDVTARLVRDFAPTGGAEVEVVLQHIAQQRRLLDSATVRDYLPVLVDRAVRRLLDPDEAAGG